MFSDTHFHFHYLAERHGDEFGAEILRGMAEAGAAFGLDIGTQADDLPSRAECIKRCLALIEDGDIRQRAEAMVHFSAGIWPSAESIKNRLQMMEILRGEIQRFIQDEKFGARLCAIGEGGIDHHWNPSGADSRSEDDFDAAALEGERELFEMQLALAKELGLPFIIHSRDGFEDTISCVKNAGCDNGILHCCSYPLEQVKPFVERGWHVSFSGSVTYTKKSRMEEMAALLRYIPEDRLLLETDAPYLAPVPMRGKENTPLLIRHTYEFVAGARNMSVESLCRAVDENCARLFVKKA